MPVAAPLLIGGLAAGGSIIGGMFQANAAQKAAETQAAAATQIAGMQQQEGQQGVGLIGGAMNLLSPYINSTTTSGPLSTLLGAGTSAIQSLASLYGLSTPGNPGGGGPGSPGYSPSNPPPGFTAGGGTAAPGAAGGGTSSNPASFSPGWAAMLQTPAYQFAQQQGILGLDRSAAANGLLLSGGQLRDVMQFNQGLATQQVGNFTNVLSGMGGYLGQGLGLQQNALDLYLRGAQGQASALNNTAQMVGSTQMGGANATAAGLVGGANAISGGIANAGNNLLLGYGMSNGYNPFGNNNSFGNLGGVVGMANRGPLMPGNPNGYSSYGNV